MPTVLTIGRDEVLTIARLDTADTANQEDADAVIEGEQAATEALLRADALADGGLSDLLRRNVAKLLAAELLEMMGREEGRGGAIQASGILLGRPDDHPARLRASAWEALGPYRRPVAPHAGPVSAYPETESPTSAANQARLFGRGATE